MCFEPLDRGLLSPLTSDDAIERVELSVDEEAHCGQHFSKLVTASQWDALEAAHAAQVEAVPSEDRECTDAEGDDSSSDQEAAEGEASSALEKPTTAMPIDANAEGGPSAQSGGFLTGSRCAEDVEASSILCKIAWMNVLATWMLPRQ